MDGSGLVSGLGALGFWLFIAAVVVAGIWYGIRERQAQHETVRRMIESGQPLDGPLLDRLLPPGGSAGGRMARDLKAGGLILLFAAPGLAVLGWLIGLQSAPWLLPLLGVAALTACVGLGFLVTARVVGREERPHGASAAGGPPAS